MRLTWGGIKRMKSLLETTGISKKLSKLGLPQGTSKNRIASVSKIKNFWVSIWIGCFRFSHRAVVRLDDVLNIKLLSLIHKDDWY